MRNNFSFGNPHKDKNMQPEKCNRCLEMKPRYCFYADRKSKTGLKRHCKTCANASTGRREWIDKNISYHIRSVEKLINEKGE